MSVNEFQSYAAQNFIWSCPGDGRVATIKFNRPDKKNPLNYACLFELCSLFKALPAAQDVRVVIIQGDGGNFCAGGDVLDIIGPLRSKSATDILQFTRMTGELVVAIRRLPQLVIASVDGLCMGGGAVIALAADMRIGTPVAKVAFLFGKLGLSGADMGATGLLPRVIGQGRASELLLTGRILPGEEGYQWGFFNQLHQPEHIAEQSRALARTLADGPYFANKMTKTMINKEWNMGIAWRLKIFNGVTRPLSVVSRLSSLATESLSINIQ
jgi:enoyl-CoA hydratase/carnithine racemase